MQIVDEWKSFSIVIGRGAAWSLGQPAAGGIVEAASLYTCKA